MAIFTGGSKFNPGAQNPENATDAGWQRNEPLLTPQQLRDRFLFGLPLVSFEPDPVTGMVQVMGDDLLEELIEEALILVEQELDLHLMPTQVLERAPWDKNLYMSMGAMWARQRPIASIEEITIQSQDGQILYRIPQEWIETGLLEKGQIGIIPLTVVSLSGTPTASPTSSGAAAYLNLMAQQSWVPAYWMIKYTTGYINGLLPKQVNQVIGCQAAIEALTQIAATNARNSSASLSIDGLSQSKGNAGPSIYDPRITELKEKKEMLVGKLKARYGRKLFSGTL